MYGLPIKKIQFHTEHNHDLVLSLDAQVCSLTYLPSAYLKYLLPTSFLPIGSVRQFRIRIFSP